MRIQKPIRATPPPRPRLPNAINLSHDIDEISGLNNSTLDSHADQSLSIGQLNQLPSTHGERCYLGQSLEDFSFPNTTQDEEKLARIDNQLFDIEQMKLVFESKRRQEQHTFHAEKQWANRSHEKHTLRPSQVPKSLPISDFSKPSNDSTKPVYEIIKQNSSQPDQFQHIEMSFQADSSRLNYNSPQSSISKQSQRENCSCQSTVNDFMTEMRQKITILTQRVGQLEEKNSRLRQQHEETAQNNMEAESRIQRLQMEKAQLSEAEERWRKGRSELEDLLKDVLIKKEKKQKENIAQEDCQLYFKQRNKQVREKQRQKQNKDKQKPYSKPQILQERGKVGTLLQRLQLRVQRS